MGVEYGGASAEETGVSSEVVPRGIKYVEDRPRALEGLVNETTWRQQQDFDPKAGHPLYDKGGDVHLRNIYPLEAFMMFIH